MWSPIIRQMLYDGTSNEAIITFFNNPIVNDEYISLVIREYKRLCGKRHTAFKKARQVAPEEGSEARKVFDYVVKNFGSVHEFLKQYDHRRNNLAEKIGVTFVVINNFLLKFGGSRYNTPKWLGNYSSLERKLIIEHLYKTGKFILPVKRTPLSKVRELW